MQIAQMILIEVKIQKWETGLRHLPMPKPTAKA
jgi:hypothetical protein